VVRAAGPPTAQQLGRGHSLQCAAAKRLCLASACTQPVTGRSYVCARVLLLSCAVTLSCCSPLVDLSEWVGFTHCDPDGCQLRELCLLLRRLANGEVARVESSWASHGPHAARSSASLHSSH
jgi:hypothetical protein